MITYVALSPHPPVIIPEVGEKRLKEVEATVQSMQSIAQELVASSPDTVIFLTPHGNVFSDCITCLTEPQLFGNLKSFGKPDVQTSHPNDLDLVQEFMRRAKGRSINLIGIDQVMAQRHRLNAQIDHGIFVPLYYLEKAGLGDKPLVAISVGYLDNIELYALGKIIQESAESLGKRIAIVASGDMSHRLKNEGPYKFHPDGIKFDMMVKDLLSRQHVMEIIDIPGELRENAGECGYCSIVIMLGALDGYDFHSKIFSYEGKFGVGYLIAALYPGENSPSIMEKLEARQASIVEARRSSESLPVKWARMTLENYIKYGKEPGLPEEMDLLRQERAGVFVSIKKHGQLRGCIGTFMPVYENIAQEIKNNALAAGLEDPRFTPVEKGELQSLVYSVDILAEPETCQREDLDPKRYGVIVSSGSRKGLLLPDLEGVDTVEQQLQIAMQKGGISAKDKYMLKRFEVKRYI
ncbi:MAG: AmmeMemoRadiSam system protein A [Syntrophomonas sp.]|nr:AmmeMemoRadiSam system protein A [Syntrophomonas sp.]